MPIDPIQFAATGQSGVANTGLIDGDGFGELEKALSAGYGTDVATLTGGAALRVQSLDLVMQATIQENAHFKLFNRLAKPKALATVDEWTEQNGVGGFPGGSTNTESGTISSATGSYARRVGMVKYLMTQRSVTFVQSLQSTIVGSEAVEYMNGALQLLTDAEHLCFEGNSSVVPTEFDGIYYQLQAGIAAGNVDPGNMIDARGGAVTDMTYITRASAQIARAGNFGTPTDIYFNQDVQADLDINLQPAYRVALTGVGEGGLKLGAPVTGIRTSNGTIATQQDVFIRGEENKQPFELLYPSSVIAAMQPAGLVASVPASDVSSLFTTAQAGNYYYYVCGTSAAGTSTGVLTDAVAIAAGYSTILTITRSATAQETGYVIYRSRLNGTNALADLREVCRIPVAGPTTTWKDINRYIPGTTKAFILNMRPGASAILWRQLLPMCRFNLYPTNAAIVPWAQLLFGYLRMSKLRHHVCIENIVPTGAVWQPFGSAATTQADVPITG
jgi:hypothetical protein